MAWYDAGTVKVTLNSAAVTGTGTQWLAGARQGEAFVAPDGRLYEVLNVASDTSLTLTKPYIGATATGQKYSLAPMQGYVKESADRLAALLLFLQTDLASVLKAADLQASPNDAAKDKILVTGKSFGLGSVGAASSYDVWPSASLNDLNVPSGIYLLSPNIADRPPEIGTQNGIVWHRQAGTAGGQLVLYPSSNVIARTRTAGAYAKWRRLLAEGDFGLGGGTTTPPNGRTGVNPFGWYYQTTVPSWGGGSFFLDMPYGQESMNAGLRLSTNPYSDDFYLQGGVSGKKEYRPACKLLHDRNIVGDMANGAVIANGSNANGIWIRFADGTQICFSNPIASPWVDLQSGSLWQSPSRTWTYPTWFYSAESTTLYGSAQESDIPIWVVHGAMRNNATGSYKVVSTIRWDVALTIRLCAIGRWKA